ncbi:hypothetical protein ACTIVE_5534 [Actinomadura verrucosospora]|uniref:Uncharacterized protein n=1 Tax=Actinomadura verrucosospora TaxID=46165 RepID=A0A7D3W1K4_ACTVE|nr:hypothetical protein ACTIVE_5534 [Actinomadura verrucosospora]
MSLKPHLTQPTDIVAAPAAVVEDT